MKYVIVIKTKKNIYAIKINFEKEFNYYYYLYYIILNKIKFFIFYQIMIK